MSNVSAALRWPPITLSADNGKIILEGTTSNGTLPARAATLAREIEGEDRRPCFHVSSTMTEANASGRIRPVVSRRIVDPLVRTNIRERSSAGRDGPAVEMPLGC